MKQVFTRTVTTYTYEAVIMNEDKSVNHERFVFLRKFKSEKSAIKAVQAKLPPTVRCLAADFVEEWQQKYNMDIDTFISNATPVPANEGIPEDDDIATNTAE